MLSNNSLETIKILENSKQTIKQKKEIDEFLSMIQT